MGVSPHWPGNRDILNIAVFGVLRNLVHDIATNSDSVFFSLATIAHSASLFPARSHGIGLIDASENWPPCGTRETWAAPTPTFDRHTLPSYPLKRGKRTLDAL